MPSLPLAAATPAETEVARQLRICNACRYCEGFCAVFPAMTRRLEFGKADVHYLANLCHGCGACLHACQYAPPHEFAVVVPQAMARVRGQTYSDYAWPRVCAALYRRNGLAVALALAGAFALFLVLAATRDGSLWQAQPSGDFYRVLPHGLMVALFGPVFLLAVMALGVGVVRFWRDITPGVVPRRAAAEAACDVLRLKYLDGGHGEGCNEEDDRFTLARRRWHQLAFYGFLLCFASTCIATLYHYGFGWRAPYPVTSLPKLLGITGGLGLFIGAAGLLRLNRARPALAGDAAQQPMDRAFIALLLLVAGTGLLLPILRSTGALGVLLALHLGAVMALFLTLPYGKFAHGVYRCAALLKWAVERRRPNTLGLSDD
ncbi:MAG TPA: tricarballylate utilization 4Fe-4S protein TcuB [Burkholderiaceae bacterium]|nr:tricarballylate utilization 4Fe-4S protein TcuB [Burkholderiaceae bacterium]